jgi:hypothetical protein
MTCTQLQPTSSPSTFSLSKPNTQSSSLYEPFGSVWSSSICMAQFYYLRLGGFYTLTVCSNIYTRLWQNSSFNNDLDHFEYCPSHRRPAHCPSKRVQEARLVVLWPHRVISTSSEVAPLTHVAEASEDRRRPNANAAAYSNDVHQRAEKQKRRCSAFVHAHHHAPHASHMLYL